MRKIVIGCDNAAVELKDTLVEYMREKGISVEDVGCESSEDPTYYPYIARKVCQKIIDSGYQKQGVLICGLGDVDGDDHQPNSGESARQSAMTCSFQPNGQS